MFESPEDLKDTVGIIAAIAIPAFYVIAVGTIILKRLFGFAPHFDVGRLFAGLFFLLFGLLGYAMMAISWYAGDVSAGELWAFIGSGALITVFVLIGIRILWLFKR